MSIFTLLPHLGEIPFFFVMTKTKFSDSVWSQRQLDPNFIFVVANAEFCDSVKSQRQVHPNLQGVGGVSDFMAILMIFTARNEVGTRLYFHRHVWFCPQGGVCSWGGCLFPGVPGPEGAWSQGVLGHKGCLVQGVPSPGGSAPGVYLLPGGMPGLGAWLGGAWSWADLPLGVPGGDPQDSYCCGWYTSYWNAFLFCNAESNNFCNAESKMAARRWPPKVPLLLY